MLKAEYIPYTFYFNFPGGTSRGVLNQKISFFIKLWDNQSPDLKGLGEVSLIPGLSPETPQEVASLLDQFIENPELFLETTPLDLFPALKFGIETAQLDLKQGGNKILFPSAFTEGEKGIRINGLVWMGQKDAMLRRLEEKIHQGFTCIKIKVGAIDFEEELNLLRYIRKSFSAQELEIRVDANGAFHPHEAMKKLDALAAFHLHSIEQPIKQGQWEAMAHLCKNSPIPIALDEELIGITENEKQLALLKTMKPQYLILKPSLLGGLEAASQWVTLAKHMQVGWWLTSALEGNVGLNALAQWTFIQDSDMPQGLGTGQVFTNNFDAPLEIRGEHLWYNAQHSWGLNF